MDRTSPLSMTGLFTILNPNKLEMENNTEIMEIILFGDEPAKELTADDKNNVNVQVVELGDRSSKMAMLQQLKLDSSLNDDHLINDENRPSINTVNSQENMETFAKLPPGTILIRQDNRSNYQQEVEDPRKPLKEMTETTSSGSTSSGAPTENPKRIQRAIRNKKTVEVRRNPTRVSKKNLDKDFVNPRQRLLSNKRKENFTNSEPSKRIKLSSTPYMNTRSVTRKLYTVGSTYQAPTIHDAMEWKEWPVHGMHERPVFHPRFGLGVEYIGRFFKTLDSRSYLDIQEEPEVEVISVDPRDKIVDSLDLKKLNRKRTERINFQANGEASGKDSKSFESCMHTSLHTVLAYCAQVSSPSYHKTIQEKINVLKTKPCNDENNRELLKILELKSEYKSGNSADKIINHLQTDSIKTKSSSFINSSKVSNLMATRMEPTKCLITPRSSSNSTMNLQASHSKLQDAIRGYSKNALILVKAQELAKENPKRVENPKSSVLCNDQFSKPSTSELNFELTKLDDSTISDETLMEMSSIYEKFVPIEDMTPSPENLPKSWEDKRTDSDLKSCQKQSEAKDNDRNKNQASEIAKILSEYIQSINKVPETQNCVLQAGIKSSRNEVNFNEQRKRECSKITENKILRKSTSFTKEQIMDVKKVQNKMEIEEVLDLSTVKSKEENINKENEGSSDVESLQNLVESTAILYCAAAGVHQSNLADYINTLDAKQSLGWFQDHNS